VRLAAVIGSEDIEGRKTTTPHPANGVRLRPQPILGYEKNETPPDTNK